MPGLLLPGRHAYGYRGAPEGITSQYLGCISVVARAGLVVRAVCFQYALMMPLLQCGIVAAAGPVALERHSAPAPVALGSLGPAIEMGHAAGRRGFVPCRSGGGDVGSCRAGETNVARKLRGSFRGRSAEATARKRVQRHE